MKPVSDQSWRRYLTFWRTPIDRDVDHELRFHLEERVADLIARGRTATQARAEAEEEFGDPEQYREELREIDRRMQGRKRRTQWLEVILSDLRYALRGIRRSPGLAGAVIVILSLGVGANATMFGLIDHLLLRAPAHLASPDRLALLQVTRPADTWIQTTQPYVFKTVMEGVSDFSGVAVATPTGIVKRTYYPVGRGVTASRAAGALVSNNYFAVLGVRPQIGRLFAPEGDTATVPERVAVLGHGYWQRQYGGSREVIGQRIQLGTEPFTIVGVLPAGFTGTEMRDVDVWLPINASPGLHLVRNDPQWRTSQNAQWLLVIARLKAGVDPRHAQAQATLALRNWYRSQLKMVTPAQLARVDSAQVSFSSMIPGRATWDWGMSGSSSDVRISKLLAAASALLLLMACANVTNLLLVRALTRRREIAVRLSLGISRPRLIAQLLVEGATLTAFGLAGALGVTAVGAQLVRRWLIGEGAFSGQVIDGRVLAFTVTVGLITGLAAALVPAIQISRADLASALKSGTRMGSLQGSRLRDGLLIAQGAVAIVLLAGATMFVRSLKNARQLDLGLDVDHAVMARIDQGTTGLQPDQMRGLFDEFVRRAEGVPGIRSAALASPLPFGGSWTTAVIVPGRVLPPQDGSAYQYYVTPKYFAVLGIRTVSGRTLTESDRPGTAIVINEALARRLWPRANPVGQCLKLDADSMPCAPVVGVVANTRRQNLVEDQPVPQVYRPIPRPGESGGSVASFLNYTLIARADDDAARTIEPLRRALQSAGPSVPYADVQTIRQRMGAQSRNWQLGSRVFGAFATLALVLAAIGLFSVVAFTVGQRMYEFGVRTALGAKPRDLARLIMLRGLRPALAGVALGIVLVLALGRFIEGLLFQESSRDPSALGMAAGILLACAALASLIPAVRAARADPRTALASE